MKINKKFIIISQVIILISIWGHVMWATAQAADAPYEITPQKTIYSPQETININFANLPTNNGDWIGIYPKNTNNDWANVVSWSYTNGTKSMATAGRSAGTFNF